MNPDGFGGAIAVSLPLGSQSSLTIRRCQFEANSSGGDGGAIATSRGLFGPLDSLVVEASRFINNGADSGGAIYGFNVGSVSIEHSVFEGNEADSGDGNSGSATGGALSLRPEDASFSRISGSTFFNNSAFGPGGAIYVQQGPTLIVNSTFANNISSTGRGNAINFSANVGAILHSTLIDNDNPDRTADSAIESSGGASVSLGHSIVYTEGLEQEAECQAVTGGTITSTGFNIDTSGTCTGHAADLPMTDPELAPFGDYGDGSTALVLQTFMPKTTGPAIEGGSFAPCPGGLGTALDEDQRGEVRPSISRCDIGAVEFQSGQDPVAYDLEVTINSGDGTITSSPLGIDCPDDCTEGYLDGTEVTLSATPAAGFLFNGWTGDCSGTGACQFVVDTNRNVAATFVAQEYPVSVSIVGAGRVVDQFNTLDCPGTCVADFPSNTVLDLVGIPDPGFELLAWGADCGGTAPSALCELTVNQPRNVTATFERIDVALSVRFEGPGSGRVTSSPSGVDCTADCSATFAPDTAVELNAITNPGSTFQNWTGACSGSGPCNVILDAATTIGAVFVDDDTLFLDSFE